VVFLGEVFPIEPFYYALDVFVVSSRWEGGPLTLLEAAAAGCPLVSTRVGFADEVIVPGRTGFLVESEDEDGLACALLRLLEDEGLADNMGEQAKVYVEKEFAIEKSVEKIREIYKAFLEGDEQ